MSPPRTSGSSEGALHFLHVLFRPRSLDALSSRKRRNLGQPIPAVMVCADWTMDDAEAATMWTVTGEHLAGM